MTRILAIAEHVISDAQSTENMDEFNEPAATAGDQAEEDIRAGYSVITLDRNTHVDALMERYRTHQEG